MRLQVSVAHQDWCRITVHVQSVAYAVEAGGQFALISDQFALDVSKVHLSHDRRWRHSDLLGKSIRQGIAVGEGHYKRLRADEPTANQCRFRIAQLQAHLLIELS